MSTFGSSWPLDWLLKSEDHIQLVLACASCCSLPSCSSWGAYSSCAPIFSIDLNICFILAFSASCRCRYAFCEAYQIRFPLSRSLPIHVILRAKLKQGYTHAISIRMWQIEDDSEHQSSSSQFPFSGHPDRIGTMKDSKCFFNRDGDWTRPPSQMLEHDDDRFRVILYCNLL